MINDFKRQLEKARQAMTGGKYQKSKTSEDLANIPKPPNQSKKDNRGEIIKARNEMTPTTSEKNEESVSEEELERARKSMSTLEQKKRQEEFEKKKEEEKRIKERMLEMEKSRKEKEEKEEKKQQTQLMTEEAEKERQEKERLERIESARAKQKELAEKNIASLPKVHTLKSDFLRSSEVDKASLASLSTKSTTAEKEKWRRRQRSEKIKKNIGSLLTTLLVILLLIGGMGLLYYSYSVWQRGQITTISELPATLLAGDEYLDIRTNDKTPTELLSSLRRFIQTPKRPGSVAVIKLIGQKIDPQTGRQYEYLIGVDELSVLNISLPREFTHFLQNDFILGTYSKGNTNEIFYILQARSFSNIFNQLITNGNQISQELFTPFITSTIRQKIITSNFQNAYLANINVRILSDDNVVYVVYGWLNRENVLITQSQEAFINITETWRDSY